jgi:hypothetical protein
MRLALTCLLAIATCLHASAALARSPCPEGAYRIEITVRGEPPSLGEAIFAELVSELGRRTLCAVADAKGERTLARIEIEIEKPSSARVRIVDTVTQKTVERRVHVRGLGADEQALPIAIAADELLRASWAELTLQDPRGPTQEKRKVPDVVRNAVKPRPAEPRPMEPNFATKSELGVEAVVAGYAGGLVELGAAMAYQYDFVPWFAGRVFAFAREGVPVESTNGTLRTHVAGGGLTLVFYPLRAQKVRFGPSAGVELAYVAFEGRPEDGAEGDDAGLLAIFGAAGARATVELRPVRLTFSADFLVPFRAVEAMDEDVPIAGATGVGAGAGIGLAVPF